MPTLVRANARLVRSLRRSSSAGSQLLRTVPAIQRRTVATLRAAPRSGLQPFVPEAETDKVEALRAMVKSEISTLVEEFGRVEEPRADRIESYLRALTGANGALPEFGCTPSSTEASRRRH
jgi:hypothetical protein